MSAGMNASELIRAVLSMRGSPASAPSAQLRSRLHQLSVISRNAESAGVSSDAASLRLMESLRTRLCDKYEVLFSRHGGGQVEHSQIEFLLIAVDGFVAKIVQSLRDHAGEITRYKTHQKG